jgi:hypothetical protein
MIESTSKSSFITKKTKKAQSSQIKMKNSNFCVCGGANQNLSSEHFNMYPVCENVKES